MVVLKHFIVVILCALVAAGVVYLHTWLSPPKQTIITLPGVEIHTIDHQVLTVHDILNVLGDPKDKATIKALLAENDKLKLDVTGLTQTIAKLESSGGTDSGGGIVPFLPPEGGEVAQQYSDWQLKATYTQTTFNYTLSQRFEILSTTGKKKDGSKIGLTKVFQLGPAGERIPLAATTIDLYADERVPHWMFSPRIQAGIGTTVAKETGAILGFQWLKHGKSKAAEDVRFAVLSPALFATKSTVDVGVLPISINLGNLPHQPFTNVWVSPFVSRTRLGATLTATF